MSEPRFAPSNDDELLIREATDADLPTILRLLSASLGWEADERFARFFEWKHMESPFGRSPAWVAVTGGEVVGFRTFVRWELEHPDRRMRRAVRAVDTATHPDHQGRGIFRRLTLHALEELRAEGVDFVFNTPNDKSRPGYLKMGWHQVGRLPAAVRPTGPRSLLRLALARVPAEHWSQASAAGSSAAEVLCDPGVEELLSSAPSPRGLRTPRTASYLRWRYGLPSLHYRAIALDDDIARGLVVFRLRSRGDATEAAVVEVLVPGGEPRATTALIGQVARAVDADYLIRLGAGPLARALLAPLPGQGPVLTARSVNESVGDQQISDWDLTLGDVELF